MPLYRYVCKTCGKAVEIIKASSRRNETPLCPTSNSHKMVALQLTDRADVLIRREFKVGPQRSTKAGNVQRPKVTMEGFGIMFAPGVTGGTAINVGNADVELVDVMVANAHTGIKTSPRGSVKSRGLRVIKSTVGVDNAGDFDGPDTVIE